MSRELWEECGIYPTQTGGAIVLLGGVAEVLERPAALMRLEYMERRLINDDLLYEQSTASNRSERCGRMCISDKRARAMRAALAHQEKTS